MTTGTLFPRTGTVDIVGMIAVTFIGDCFGTGVVFSGVGLGLVVGMTGGAQGIAR